MIPPERLHEIAESRRISPSWGEVEAMAAELLAARESISLPGYQRIVDERDAARAEAKKYHDALVARHGGEPVALLSELDAARAEVERLQPKVCCGKFGEAIPECSTCVPKLRAEVERLAKQRDDLLAAAEPVADALRDIAGSGHGVYLAAYQAAVEAIGYEWAKNPKPPAPRPVGWFRLNGVEFHPVDGTAEERERAVAVLTRALGVKMYPKPAGGA